MQGLRLSPLPFFGANCRRGLVITVIATAWVLLGPALFSSDNLFPREGLAQAHAHNDYEHDRPLLDALSHGFTSVEADIFRVDDSLLVAHDRHKAHPDRTLQGLYLEPLARRARTNEFRIYTNHPTFYLLIDIKSEAESTYALLETVLAEYKDVLTEFSNSQIRTGAVTVILSGNRPLRSLPTREERWCALDGRLSDLANPSTLPPVSVMPWISDNWYGSFRWRGRDVLAESERQQLHELVRKAHEAGRQIRFWGHPDRPEAWQELRESGVDFINTDRLKELASFLRTNATDPPGGRATP